MENQKKQNYFLFYRSFYDSISKMPKTVRNEVLDMILEYSFNDIEKTAVKQMSKCLFDLIRPQLDANRKRYENARKGGAPKGSKNNPNGRPRKSAENTGEDELEITNQKLTNDKNKKEPKTNLNKEIINNKEEIINIEKSNIINDITKKENQEPTVEQTELKLPQSKIAIKTIEQKKQEFKQMLLDPKYGYAEKYGTDMLADFYNYWTECNPNGKLLRWEMQKVFDTSRRLATWAKNCKNKSNFNYNYGNNQSNYQTAGERGRNAHATALANILAKYSGNEEIVD